MKSLMLLAFTLLFNFSCSQWQTSAENLSQFKSEEPAANNGRYRFSYPRFKNNLPPLSGPQVSQFKR